MNVVGFLQGRDPELNQECVVLGAHLDHLGKIGRMIFPGANDNASGVAVVLEVAEAFVESQIRPRRSVVFIAFTGEEIGLVGARHFIENLLIVKRGL